MNVTRVTRLEGRLRRGTALCLAGILLGAASFTAAKADGEEPFQPQSQPAPKADRPMQTPVPNREDLALPPVFYGVESLPAPVAETRQALITAALSGDIEQLAGVLATRNEVLPELRDTPVNDPVAYWRSISFDGTGRDVLAQMLKILRSGYAHVDAGTPKEMFIWPYHSVYPLDRLNPQQEVELYVIVTPREVREMDPAEGYTGYRIGISNDGSVRFFRSSD